MIEWTRLNEPLALMIGEKNSVIIKGTMYSYHVVRGRGWILRKYRGSWYASKVWSETVARGKWNDLLIRERA